MLPSSSSSPSSYFSRPSLTNRVKVHYNGSSYENPGLNKPYTEAKCPRDWGRRKINEVAVP